MDVVLDLTEIDRLIFAGPANASRFLQKLSGDGHLSIKIKNNRVISSSFIYGLLLSDRFHSVVVIDGTLEEVYAQEVKRALNRYSKKQEI